MQECIAPGWTERTVLQVYDFKDRHVLNNTKAWVLNVCFVASGWGKRLDA